MTFLLIHRKCCVLFIYFTVGILWEKKSIVVKKQLFRHLILYLLLHYFGAVFGCGRGLVSRTSCKIHENAFKSPKRFPSFTVSRRCPVGWIEVFARPILVLEPYV